MCDYNSVMSIVCLCSTCVICSKYNWTDIDECASETNSCDRRTYIRFTKHGLRYFQRGVCHNTQGGFTCSCNPGLQLSSESRCIGKQSCDPELPATSSPLSASLFYLFSFHSLLLLPPLLLIVKNAGYYKMSPSTI